MRILCFLLNQCYLVSYCSAQRLIIVHLYFLPFLCLFPNFLLFISSACLSLSLSIILFFFFFLLCLHFMYHLINNNYYYPKNYFRRLPRGEGEEGEGWRVNLTLVCLSHVIQNVLSCLFHRIAPLQFDVSA